MPPNAQDAHGSTGLAVTAAPAAAAANKMDCFLTTACTPFHLQVRTPAASTAAAAAAA